MVVSLKKVLQELFWPATAGNVAWAFFTLAIDSNWLIEGVAARLLALLLLAIYLVTGFREHDGEKDTSYYVADGIHLTSIIVFAIATQLGKSWVECSLIIVLAVTTVGHLIGVWEPNHRKKLASASFVGIIIIFASHLFENPYPNNLPVALGVVLIVWYGVRNKVDSVPKKLS